MPQDRPPYSKLIFITYNSDENDKARNYAICIYQRLKYARLPVRTYEVDEAIGGGGFDYNSIEAASPMIVVLSANPSYPASKDLDTARDRGKEVIFFCLANDIVIPEHFQHSIVFVSPSIYGRDELFSQLRDKLLEREYPAPRGRISPPDGDRWLREARNQKDKNRDEDNFFGNLNFYRDYFYMNVFNDLYNKAAKLAALHDLGEKRILSGLVIAALQDDPQEEVRAAAALSLAKFEDYDLDHYIYESSQLHYPEIVKIYAQLALIYRREPNLIPRIVADLTENFIKHEEIVIQATIVASAESLNTVLDSTVLQHQLFISYARKDAETIALEFAKNLEDKRFTIWIDTKLEPGTPIWAREIQNAIRNTSVMVVLVSPAVHDSVWVRNEIGVAHDNNKHIIPVFALRTKMPIELRGIQGLRGEPILIEEPEKVLILLIEALNRKGIVPKSD